MKLAFAAVLHALRSRFAWKMLGSFIFVIAMTRLPSVPLHRGDPDDDNNGVPTEHIPPFAAGFLAAGVLTAAWRLDYEREHPRRLGNPRMPVLDYESGQLVMPKFYTAEGNKWPWIACLRELKSGDMHMLEIEANTLEHDLDYAEDIHIVPSKLEEDDHLAGHDFTRSCKCVPVIMEQARGRTLIIHVEKDYRIDVARRDNGTA